MGELKEWIQSGSPSQKRARSVCIEPPRSGEKEPLSWQSAMGIKAKFAHIIAQDPATIAVLQQAVKLAQSELDVMIIGESGVGKELLARGIHDLSRRAKGPFVAVNLPTFPETIFESEFFGHEKGAFTGASKRHLGRLEQAPGGTLFLDEIGHLRPPLQAKLLWALEDKTFRRRACGMTSGSGILVLADPKVISFIVTQRAVEKEDAHPLLQFGGSGMDSAGVPRFALAQHGLESTAPLGGGSELTAAQWQALHRSRPAPL